MKIVTKIYLSIGFILLAFTVVTLFFIYQSFRTDQKINQALLATEITRRSEALQKDLVDVETGLRGFLITENPAFLEPYYEGLQQATRQFSRLQENEKDPFEVRLVQEAESLHRKWVMDFAEPVIKAKMEALEDPLLAGPYDSLYTTLVLAGQGKKLMDQIRSRFDQFDKLQVDQKNRQVAILNSSLRFSRIFAFVLTAVAICFGVVTAFLVGSTIHRRLTAMIDLSYRISEGDFKVQVSDQEKDEMSQLSSSLNKMAHKLQTYFTNLAKTNRELDQFAYVVSHDLKAPLRAINNLAEWLSEDIKDQDPDIQKNLSLMRGRVQRMENLINGILEYSKIGRREVATETFNVLDLLREIIDSLAPPPDFTILLPPRAPTLTTEKIFLQQVLTNLISNGIKYNNKASGQLEIDVQEGGDFFEFTVTDNGPGIPAAFHQKIFGVFQTMESRDTLESTGVGLAIVKKIIDEKGGTIRVKSEADVFTSFIFTWPKAYTTDLNTKNGNGKTLF